MPVLGGAVRPLCPCGRPCTGTSEGWARICSECLDKFVAWQIGRQNGDIKSSQPCPVPHPVLPITKPTCAGFKWFRWLRSSVQHDVVRISEGTPSQIGPYMHWFGRCKNCGHVDEYTTSIKEWFKS